MTEAIRVFSTVKPDQLLGLGNKADAVTYDYMNAYLDFFRDGQSDPAFAVARELVAKYKDYPVLRFRKMFAKIEEQLNEIDSSAKAEVEAFDSDDEKDKKVESAKKQTKQIHEIKINKSTGLIDIESENLEAFVIKYYLIDAEILFSRSPFIQDQAEQFSYVKPFLVVEKKSAPAGQTTKVSLPEELKGKNVVIEINSEGIQKF